MMKKQISKITMMASLLVATMVNAQEFYTCVPKKSWWSDIIKSNVPSASDIANAIPKPQAPTPNWRLIKKGTAPDINLTLEPGKYKFILKTQYGKTIQSIVDSPTTANLHLIARYTSWCRSYKNDVFFLDNYNRQNIYYFQKEDFSTCTKDDHRAGVSALVLGSMALFAYECKCSSPNLFHYSTLEIYKKNDD